MSPVRNWTVHLVRRDGLESHTLDIGRGRLILIVAAATAVILGSGVVGGLFWASRTESVAIARLDTEIRTLRAERAQVTRLAERLASVERAYEVLQTAVTVGRPEPTARATIPVGQPAARVARPAPEETSLAWPLAQRGFVTRTFGSRAEASPEGHTGLDIAVPTGSYVRAIRAGRVDEAGEDSVYGKFLRIAHADGLTSLYGHNAWLFASSGDEVERLQVIALSGNTGRSTAPHLHLELALNGSLLDPLTMVTDDALRGVGADPEQN